MHILIPEAALHFSSYFSLNEKVAFGNLKQYPSSCYLNTTDILMRS